MKKILLLILLLALFLIPVKPAFSGLGTIELFGIATDVRGEINPEAVAIEIPEAIFYSIDPQTGTPTMIGPTGYRLCGGLDIMPVTGEFFAVCERPKDPDINPRVDELEPGPVLVKIDELTGQATEVGPLGIDERGLNVSDISFNRFGILYAHVQDLSELTESGIEVIADLVPANENTLGIINTNSGQLTVIGPTGIEDGFSAIAFNASDILYHATDNRFIPEVFNTLNVLTGASIPMFALTHPPEFTDTNILTSMDFANSTGDLFGILFSGIVRSIEGPVDAQINVEAPLGFFLVDIDPNTGNTFVIGPLSENEKQFSAIAARGEDLRAQVPTLSEYGLIVTVVMLFGAAVFFLRRRQVSSTL